MWTTILVLSLCVVAQGAITVFLRRNYKRKLQRKEVSTSIFHFECVIVALFLTSFFLSLVFVSENLHPLLWIKHY